MNKKTTKAEAVEVLSLITKDHANTGYFLGADVVSNEGNWGVDLKVKRAEWKSAGLKAPPTINKVHVCVLLVG